jgi:hypothetical protein
MYFATGRDRCLFLGIVSGSAQSKSICAFNQTSDVLFPFGSHVGFFVGSLHFPIAFSRPRKSPQSSAPHISLRQFPDFVFGVAVLRLARWHYHMAGHWMLLVFGLQPILTQLFPAVCVEKF